VPQRDAGPAARIEKGRAEGAAFDHMGEGLAGLDLARKGKEHRADGILQAAVGDDHVDDGLRLGRDLVPHPERRQHPPRACRDRVGSLVLRRVARERGVA
jgi:hypothetical protein